MNAAVTRDFLKRAIKTTSVLLLSRGSCPECRKVESLFANYRTKPTIIHVDERHDVDVIKDAMKKLTGGAELPKLFIGGSYFGDMAEIETLHREGVLEDLVHKASGYSVKHIFVR